MNKLLILDKDGTLVRPKSGAEFVQHPEDQALLPGVAEAIARYAAEGWTMAIAGNQGGCMIRECKALDFPAGAYYCNGNDKPLMIIRKKTTAGGILLYTAEPRSNGEDWLYFDPSSKVSFQYKTLDDAVEEMQYCLALLPQIDRAFFCPDDGATCERVGKDGSWIGLPEDAGRSWNFRKPNLGMICWAAMPYARMQKRPSKILMVGDRPEDQGAAKAAGVDFMWADQWRGDRPRHFSFNCMGGTRPT